MKYILKNVDVQAYYDQLLKAYYDFNESLHGKSPASGFVHRRLDKKGSISSAYGILDPNYEYALDTLANSEKDYDICFVGAYDENDVLSAISRVRHVFEPEGHYICISEIIPLIEEDPFLLSSVIELIEEDLIKYQTGDFISFEVPTCDADFQVALKNRGYLFCPTKVVYPTILYDKPLQKNKSLK